ncbi:uncharacterized protein LOC135347149 [Halichondria panicea]|uniref:uncharacterized protein LOC135347149 n=1 Tax=Halichondria panicea TaxID=6063 RepID=UPI00312B3726
MKTYDEEEKQAFLGRLKHVRELLKPPGSPLLDNFSLLSTLCASVEGDPDHSHPPPTPVTAIRSFMSNNGMYKNDTSDGQQLFATEYHCFTDLVKGLATPCPCGVTRSPWEVQSIVQKGHVVRALFCCRRCKVQKRKWSSSRVFGGHYLVNQKVVHGFTCAGILPSQYTHFSQFCGLGTVGQSYIRQVYGKLGYRDIVQRAANVSMMSAVFDVKALPEYTTNKGEWVITDARHDSTANAYHTTVPCLSGSNKKILGISTLSRAEHSTAQTRELACTKLVIPQVQSRGIEVIEVAHDMQAQVAKYVSDKLGLINSYDTWHGTKNVSKEIKKVTQGLVRDRGKVWFPELSDKRRSIKIHLYWAMKNCGGSAEKLKEIIMNIPNHYQRIHTNCHPSSTCHMDDYEPSRDKLVSRKAIEALIKQLHTTYIYRYAKDFCSCRDTYWVESFNHQLLTYLPKCIHFSTETFIMRMNLAVLDWNENVNRSYTSMSKVSDLRRPDRRTAMKALVKKGFKFVALLWAMYVEQNKADMRELIEEDDVVEEQNDDVTLEDGVMPPEYSDESEAEDDDMDD